MSAFFGRLPVRPLGQSLAQNIRSPYVPRRGFFSAFQRSNSSSLRPSSKFTQLQKLQPASSSCGRPSAVNAVISAMQRGNIRFASSTSGDQNAEKVASESSEKVAEVAKKLESFDDVQVEMAKLTTRVDELEKNSKKGGRFNIFRYFAEYGVPFIVYWVSLWLFGGVAIYGLLAYQIFAWDQIKDVIEAVGIDITRISPTTGCVAMAIIINELIEPLRFAFCIATIKPLLKWLKKAPK